MNHNNNDLRRDILITLAYIPFLAFRPLAILNALRPTGYSDLTEITLMGQIKYLEQKGFLKIDKATNVVTGEEVTLVTITPKGIDCLEGHCDDIGVSRGR